MENREKIDSLIQEKDTFIRGNILKNTVYVERCMDFIISRYYCSAEKQNEFRECVLWNRSFNFDFKMQLLKIVLEKERPKFKEKYKKEINWIQNVMEFRNVVAHALIDTSEEAVDLFTKTLSIRYIKYRNGIKEYETFDTEKVNRLNEIFNGLAVMINKLAEPDESPDDEQN